MTDSKTVSVYTDGACPSNPSPTGGIGIYTPSTGIGIGYKVQDEDMTNNRAEMLAVIMALMSEDAGSIEIFTDSEYVSKNLTENIQRWRSDNYKGIKNSDLWEILYDLTYGAINVRFVYVTFVRRGSHVGNKVADALASGAANTTDNMCGTTRRTLILGLTRNQRKDTRKQASQNQRQSLRQNLRRKRVLCRFNGLLGHKMWEIS